MKCNSRWAEYLVWLAALVPLVVLRDFTPDNELRYLSIADEALRDGHLFAFFNHGVPYADKPPLYFWIVMAARCVAGRHVMWLLALFSLVPALATAELMDRWTRDATDGPTRAANRRMLLTTAFFLGSAVVVRMDMLMTLFIVAALLTFYRMYAGRAGRAAPWLFPLWLFLGLFTKGPLGVLVPLASVAVFLAVEGRLSDWRRYLGWRMWLVLGGLFAVWMACARAEGGRGYVENLLFHQTVDRAVDAFHHKKPFWYYFTTAGYALAPWVLFYVAALAAGLRRRLLTTPLLRFFFTVTAVTWLLLSLISSKLQIYLLPAYPFMAALAGMLAAAAGKNRWFTLSLAAPAALFVLALPAYAVARGRVPLLQDPFVALAAGLLSVSGTLALVSLFRRGRNACIGILAAGLLAALFAGSWALPRFEGAIGYRKVARRAAALAARSGSCGYAVCSLKNGADMDAYLGRPVRRIPSDSLGRLEGPGLLIVSARELRRDSLLRSFVSDRKRIAEGPYEIVVVGTGP